MTMNLNRVSIEFVPPGSTMKHQPLDLGLIATPKMRYRSKLLSAMLETMVLKHNTNYTFKEKTVNGKWGLRDGLLSHVGDAVMLFNSEWNVMTRPEIMKCWVKSECLGVMHVDQFSSIQSIIGRDTDVDIDLTIPDNERTGRCSVTKALDSKKIADTVADYRNYADESETTLSEVSNIVEGAELIAVLDSPAPDDYLSLKQGIGISYIVQLYDSEDRTVRLEATVNDTESTE